MTEKGTIRRVFPGGNTSCGFYSFYDYILPQEEAQRIFIIKGGPGVGKSTFMKRIADKMVDMGYDVEYEQCSSDNDSLDGILIPSIKVALFDGTAPHIVDPKNPGAVDEIINLGEYWNESRIAMARSEVLSVNKRTGKYFKTAYSLLKEAKVAYDEWKGYVEECKNMAEYNKILTMFLKNVFEGAPSNYDSAPKNRHLFASAITPGGFKNYIDTLIKPGMKVYALEGEPGTGVKEIIGRAAQTAFEMGMFTEQFHCPFEPEKLDMVIIHDIDTVIINTSRPFHYDIACMDNLNLKETINLNQCVKEDALSQYKPELEGAKARFYSLIDKAVEYLSKAKALHDTMEKYYVSSMDFDKISKKRLETLERILQYTK